MCLGGFDIIDRLLVFLIIILRGHLGDIYWLTSFLANHLLLWGNIGPRGIGHGLGLILVFFLLLFSLLLCLFFSGLFKEFLVLKVLFSLASLINLQDLLVNLIVIRSQTYLQERFSLRTLLIEVGTSLNLGPGLSLIGYKSSCFRASLLLYQ